MAYRAEQSLPWGSDTLIDNLPLAMAVSDGEDNIVHFNRRFVEIFGYTVDSVPDAESWWSLAYPDPEYRRRVMSHWRLARRSADAAGTGETEPLESSVTCSDGSVKRVEFRSIRLGDHRLIVCNDLTDRHKAAQVLQESEQRYRALSDAAPVGIYEQDVSGRPRYTNARFHEITGLKPGFTEIDFVDLIHPDDRAPAIAAWEGFIRTEQDETSNELRFCTASHGDCWVQIRSRKLRDADGSTSGYLCCLTDVTATKVQKQVYQVLIGSLGGASGMDFFEILARETACLLGATRVFVGKKTDDPERGVAAVVVWHRGEFVPPKLRPPVGAPSLALMQTGEFAYWPDLRTEFPHRAERYVEWGVRSYAGIPLRTPRGVLVGAIGVMFERPVLDVALVRFVLEVLAARAGMELERVAVEESLRASEENFRTLVEHAPDAIVVFNADTMCFEECNPNAEQLFKLSRRELLRHGPFDLSPPIQPGGRLTAELGAQYIERTLAGECPVFEWIHRDATGALLTCEVRLARLPDPGKRLIRGSILDISQRKKTEDTLRESEERFRQLIENSSELVLLTTPEGVALYASPNHASITKRAPEELLGTNVLEHVHPDDRATVARHFRGRTNPPVFRYRFGDGSWHWLESYGRAFRLSTGEERGVIVSRDVTERVNAEESRRKLEAQLRQAQKLEAVGTLAGGIAHDFNNVLTGIMGHLQLAALDIPSNHPIATNLSEAERASRRARDLIAQILTFSRRQEQRRAPADIGPVIREALRLLRASIPTTIEIRCEIADRCPQVLCDVTQIHQIVMNLGANAAHAMRDGGGKLTVSLFPAEIGESDIARHPQLRRELKVGLRVKDTGCGIDEATLERIFEPFFTTKGPGEGSGLGLPVVHGIVEEHGGAVVVDSAPGNGTTVSVFFPPAVAGAAGNDSNPGLPDVRGNGERILIVDDEHTVVDLAAVFLERLGFRPRKFVRPADALEAFRAAPREFDAVVTDLTMPEFTGVELVRQILEIRPDIPVIIATGYLRSDSIEKARALGVKNFLRKPFDLSEFATLVRAVTAGRTARTD